MSHPLLDLAATAKHDLGKYVAFELRWLPPDCADAELRQALVADLLETRRGPGGVEGAVAIWSALRPGFSSLQEDPDLAGVEAGIAAIAAAEPALRADTLDRSALDALAGHAEAIAGHLKALHRRLREG